MRCEINSYHPTLWRTCRALANERRLLCLKAILMQPLITVGEVAVIANIPENQASINLRALQARGLITAQRKSRWTHYLPSADPLVEHAALVLAALRKSLITERQKERHVIALLKAFTHSRRLTILSYLQGTPRATTESLVAATHISRPAMWRHLTVLKKAGFVGDEDEKWSLLRAKTTDPLAKALLSALAPSFARRSE